MKKKQMKQFKILFVMPDFNYVAEYMSDYSGVFSLSVGYLSATLKRHGFQTALIHLIKQVPKMQFVKRVREENPDMIGFTFFTHQRGDVAKYISYLREEGLKIPIIVGGVHPTTDPEDSIKIPGVDFVCVGEGEYPLLDLCNRMYEGGDVTNIPNLWVKTKQGVIKNEIRPLLQNLDELPFPDRDIFDYPTLVDTKLGWFEVITTRGCPYNCTYCCNHIYQRIYKGKGAYVRYRKPEAIVREIKQGLKKYPYLKYVHLLDDSFCVEKKRAIAFCKLYHKEVNLPFSANTRVNLIDEQLVRAMKHGNCSEISIGIESGNPQLREKVLRRFMTNEQIIKCVKLFHKYEIKIITYNILGLPTETMENMLETIKLNAKAGSDSMHVSIFQPYPNTELYEFAHRKGMVKNDAVSTFFGKYLLKHNSVSSSDVQYAYRYFYIYVVLYRTIGRFRLIERMLDTLFLSRKTHRVQMFLQPALFFITHPLLTIYRRMIKIAPKPTQWIRNVIVNRKFILQRIFSSQKTQS